MGVCDGSSPTVHKLDMRVFREMIAMAIIEHDLPYSFVEYRRIRMALAYANSTIKFWSRNTAAADVLKIFEKEKNKLREILTNVPNRVCLTTDLWRAITIEGYLCLTAHYIDTDWNLKSKILSFTAFPPPHSGIAIAMKLIELLKEWGLEKKVFCLTVDNASANDSMQSIMKRQLEKDLVCNGEFFHVRCSAHILNLIVQDGLDVIGGALQKIRDSVKFVKGSESREIMFANAMETVGMQAKEGLILDVVTRWNSTYHMLSRAIKFKDVLRNLADVEPSYKSFPSDLEWSRGELICEFLRPFSEMTNLISGSSYPTANLYFMQVWKIECWLRVHEYSADETICQMVEIMKLKFDKYWEEYSDILAIAAVFDPRLKFTCLEYCFTTLDSSTSKFRLAHVRSKMYKLFKAYKKRPSINSTSSSQVETLEEDIPAGYSGFYAFFSQKAGSSGKSELDIYLGEPTLDMVAFRHLNVLAYWKENSSRFKELSSMACDVLSIPITTVAAESSFSIGSRVLDKYRSSLIPQNVQALICTRNWLRGFPEEGEEEEEEKEKEKEKEKEEA
ncbi:Ribonuclease H-like superfamily [Arabidopsis thaliana x Arabidopsis arenosa]|uniref:Ribonuclease H-like superfamily n=1 Tax=Arabidopsis thaliana x Arabidopsis arenosa TaxID=1240361 RepID=A0A8T2AZQ6_9BRAS|nr:Ribonuclease H-like superfamily [Arabidopsis thaliana x Arabidopsis arenosa]